MIRYVHTSSSISDYKWVVLESEVAIDLNEIRVYPNNDIKIDTFGSNMFFDQKQFEEFLQLCCEAQKGYDTLVEEIAHGKG